MKNKRLKLITLLLFSVGLTNAQETVLTTGGEAWGSGGSVSYSVGQMAYTVKTGFNGSMSQGVQQPYEILTITGTEKKSISLLYKVFPNPVVDILILKVDASTALDIQSMEYQLYDINGKLIKSNKLTDKVTEIDLLNLKSSTYFLKVISKEIGIKTFKIIKR